MDISVAFAALGGCVGVLGGTKQNRRPVQRKQNKEIAKGNKS